MPARVDVEESLTVGSAWFASKAPAGGWAVVFEDDGDTGYFYACRVNSEGDLDGVVDALHIYNVRNIVDKDTPSTLQIAWNKPGLAAVLVINKYAHAVYDFANKVATCRSGFPPSNGNFTDTHEWQPGVLKQFR
jgi:hypothetical protein